MQKSSTVQIPFIFSFSTVLFYPNILKILPDIAIMVAFDCEAYFKELKKRKIVYFIYLDIHYFCVSYFSLDFPIFHLVSFPFSTKDSLYSSSVAVNSHSFPSPENVFFSSSFLKKYFHQIENYGLLVLFHTLKNVLLFFLPPWFHMRNTQSFKLLFPCKQYISFLWPVSRFFFFVFNFSSVLCA